MLSPTLVLRIPVAASEEEADSPHQAEGDTSMARVQAINCALVKATPDAGLPLASDGESSVVDFANSLQGGMQVIWDTLAYGAGTFKLQGSLVDSEEAYDDIEDSTIVSNDAKQTIAWDLGRFGLRFYKVVYVAPGGSPAGVWRAYATGKGGE
jgi:hypothetical protein